MPAEPPPTDLTRTPRFSVLIPVRNGAPSVERAVESVLDQTKPDWELVIGDNASTDGTGDVARRFTDPRIRYVRWDRAAEIFENFERTYGLARGEWVFLLPADDLLRPECLARIGEAIDGHRGSRALAAVLTRASRIDADGRPIEVSYYGVQGPAPVAPGVYDAAGWLAAVCIPGSPPWDGGAFRRAAIESAGGFFRTDVPSMSADLELIIRIASRGDVAYLDEPLMAVTGSEGSHTPGRVRRNLERGEPFTTQGIAYAEGLRAHEMVRLVSRAERRAVAAAIARTHLRRATAHRTRAGGHGRRGALADVLRAAALSPGTVAQALPVAAATIVMPASLLVTLRERALGRRRQAASTRCGRLPCYRQRRPPRSTRP